MVEQAQSETRQRTRPENTGGFNRQADAGGERQSGSSDSSWMHHGDEARQTSRAESARAEARRASGGVFRFWLPGGTSGDVVVLDTAQGPCFYEHQLQDPATGKYTIFELCPRETDDCVLCERFKKSIYVMFLSIIDTRPWTRNDGTVVRFQRKLLAVKNPQHEQFFNLHRINGHGSFRGMHLLMTRPAGQTQSSAIGTPNFVTMLSEQQIRDAFSHPAVMYGGRQVAEENEYLRPLDYSRIFRRPSGEDLRARYGGAAPAGSADDNRAVTDAWGGQGGAATTPTPETAPETAPATEAPTAATGAPAGGGFRPVAQNTPSAESASPPAGGQTQDIDDEIPF